MGIIKDCPRSSMEKCTDKYGCVGACKAVEQFEKEWREESAQKREWINLTVQEREKLRDEYGDNPSGLISAVQMMLKEKNT